MIGAPAFRYHGGKFRLSPWVHQHLPAHRVYVEPFGGAAGVLLTKPRSYSEVYNDLDGDVVNLFRVLQDPALRERLVELCLFTPYARSEFDLAWEQIADPVDRARRLLVRAQMGFGSAGATKGKTGFRISSHRDSSTAHKHWSRFPEGLAAVGERFTGVLIENRPAVDVMQQHDSVRTLHYVDPPYMHSARVMAAGKAGYYRHEMTESDHMSLLSALRSLTGMVVVSGYRTDLYDSALSDWKRVETTSRISAGRGCKTRTECMWISPSAQQSAKQPALPLGDVA